MLTVFVFGNQDVAGDNRVFEVIKKIKDVTFKIIKPNEDIPIQNNLVILDAVEGIDQVEVFDETIVDRLVHKGVSAHDYDLGFQLRYLKKIGKTEEGNDRGNTDRGRDRLRKA